jgi:hypothetical protein
MRSFLKNITLISLISILLFVSAISWSYYQITGSVLDNCPEEIDYLILGDSHAQNGIDPNLLNGNSYNFASSGETYFFCLQKLNFLLAHNKKVNHLILTLAPHNIDKKIDSLWVINENNFIAKTSSYFPIINFKEFLLFSHFLNPDYTLYSSIASNLASESIYQIERAAILKKSPFLGGYAPKEKKLELSSTKPKASASVSEFSEIQINYLNKIIELCSNNNIPLTLINIPTFHGQELNTEIFSKLKNPYSYLNMGSLFNNFPDYFADSNHLNPTGAEVFTKALNDSIQSIYFH